MENENKNEQQEQTTQTTTEQAAAQAFDASMLASPANPSGADSRDAEIAELRRQLQEERVEKGRLRSTNDELRKANEKIARLEAENAKLSRRNPEDYLSSEEREKIDPEQLAVIDKMVQGRMVDANAAMKAENDRLREEMAKRDASAVEMRKAQFDAEVQRMAPGLVQAVMASHVNDWQKWSQERRRASSVAEAFRTFDAATVAEFLKEFAESKGIHAEVSGVAARPSSSYSPRGGNHPTDMRGDTATYTLEQFNQALRAAAADYDAGRITLEERRAIQKKFNNAMAEGRVVVH